MSRLFLPNRFCAKCTQLATRESPLLTPRGALDKRSVFNQQQRRHVGGSNTGFFKYRSKSRIWICGVGVGIALAVGLKCHSDAANSSCDVQVTEALRTDRYSRAIAVSRDLVERIKVGTEVGLWTARCGSDHYIALSIFSALTSEPPVWVQCVFVCVDSQDEVGAPGLVVGVSVDGAQVWCEGWCHENPLY